MAGPECATLAVGRVSQSEHLKANHHSLRGWGGAAPSSIAGGAGGHGDGGGGGQYTLLSNGVSQQTSPSIISQSAVVSLDKGAELRPRRPAVWAPSPLGALSSPSPPPALLCSAPCWTG